jgi:hypothetical protein
MNREQIYPHKFLIIYRNCIHLVAGKDKAHWQVSINFVLRILSLQKQGSCI